MFAIERVRSSPTGLSQYGSMLYCQGLYNPALRVDFLFGTVACKGPLAQALLQEGQTKKNVKV